jgi:phosphoglycerate dehydrogenase-like enzyme
LTETLMRCAVLDDYQGVANTYADWSRLSDRVGVRTLREHVTDEAHLAEMLSDDEIIVLMRERTPFGASLFDRLPRLRLLVTTGYRNASIDLVSAARNGVTVCGTASGLRPPAELTWALILGLARNVVTENVSLRADGPWQSTIGTDLAGATLGLVGLGRIGGDVARVGQAFGMNVQAWSPHLTPDKAAMLGVRAVESLTDLCSSSDFVSVHLVLGEGTRGIVDKAAIGSMKPSAFLINTARSALVDQAALIDALKHGRIAGAGLDVFDLEPLPPRHAFRKLPNVLATPHLGYVTTSNYATYFTEAVEDIEAFLNDKPIRLLV